MNHYFFLPSVPVVSVIDTPVSMLLTVTCSWRGQDYVEASVGNGKKRPKRIDLLRNAISQTKAISSQWTGQRWCILVSSHCEIFENVEKVDAATISSRSQPGP